MNEHQLIGPRHDPWTVAIFAASEPRIPIGSGLVIDEHRVLTCRHVVAGKHGSNAPLSVTFPKAGLPKTVRCQVASVRSASDADVSVLELAEPVPPEVAPAPLRSPRPADLVGDQWWAFGFPRDSELGMDAHGVVGASLAYGWVRLDTRSRYVVRPGFSGAALWSNDFHAVVGLVGQAQRGGDHPGDALAITLHEAAKELPDEHLTKLSAWSIAVAGESALEAWGWSLESDVEAVRHWRPRARGVSIDTETGYRFRGRTAALTTIVTWLQRSRPDRLVLVVTGSPGVGKSAVLGRVVTTADPGVRAALPSGDRNARAPVGSIACAVHVKGKTALDVAAEIARAASVRVPRAVDDLVPALRQRLAQRAGRTPFNLVIDALDEASSPKQARLIISALLLPITRTCAQYGAQVVVGSRRVDDGGKLLRAFGSETRIVDLDTEEYFAEADLAEYAFATLALVGDERAGNPYAEPAVAKPVAKRIAGLANRNFLIAGLIARSHGLYDTTAVDPATLAFTPTVHDALTEYLTRLPPLGRVPATEVLTALAYAQAPGLSVDLWRVALSALSLAVEMDELDAFVHSSAANFLVESSNDAGIRRYRLFHQALNDALLRERAMHGSREADELMLARHLIGHGRRVGWNRVDPYLLRSLPTYADRAGMIDELLIDDSFLLHTDLPRLTVLAEHAESRAGMNRARLLQLTPHAIMAPPAERAALFAVTAELEQFGDAFANFRGVPYRARWAAVVSRAERAVLEGHAGAVRAICQITVAGQPHLATVGDYQYVRLWNPATGRHWEVPVGEARGDQRGRQLPGTPWDQFFAVCPVVVGGRSLLAVAGRIGRIYFIDPATGRPAGTLTGHSGAIRALCTVTVDNRLFLVSGGDDKVVRMWNLADGRPRMLSGHTAGVHVLSTISRRGRELIVSGGADYAVRLWDPAAGQLVRTITAHIDQVRAVCSLPVGSKALLATANFQTAQLWDLSSGAPIQVFEGHTKAIRGMAAINIGGQELLATAADGDVRVWELDGSLSRVLSGHTDIVTAVCSITMDGRNFLASASRDRTVRLWDLAAGRQGRGSGRRGSRVTGACIVQVSARQLVATADAGTGMIRLQDAETGAEVATMTGRAVAVNSICTVNDGYRDLIATASDGGIVQVWDPATGERIKPELAQFDQMHAICPFVTDYGDNLLAIAGNGRKIIQFWRPGTRHLALRRRLPSLFLSEEIHAHVRRVHAIHQFPTTGPALLATAGQDDNVMIWDQGGRHQATLRGHRGPVQALTSALVEGQIRLISGSADQTIRIWDPNSLKCLSTMTGHTDAVNAICSIGVDDRLLLASAGQDRTVKVWDPASRSLVMSIPVHHPALACINVSGVLFVGLTAGSLALDINPSGNYLAHFREIGSGRPTIE
jgi:WD40 repeat protein